MLLAPQPIMPRQSPMFLEVPRIKRSRSRSKPRDSDTAGRRSRSPGRRSPDQTALPLVGVPRASPVQTPSPSLGLVLRPQVTPRHRYDSPPPRQASQQQDHTEALMKTTHTPEPQPHIPLRSRLVGAWRLESYISYPTPNSPLQRPTFPMTKAVTGLLMYTPDGYMSSQMLIPGQSADAFKAKGPGDADAWAEAAKRCFAYCGPYYISDDDAGREVLRHTFQLCSLPGWVGDVQVRTWGFEEDGSVLVLGSEQPAEIKGDLRMPVLKWRRCMDNSRGSPPPPVPQIKISGPGEP